MIVYEKLKVRGKQVRGDHLQDVIAYLIEQQVTFIIVDVHMDGHFYGLLVQPEDFETLELACKVIGWRRYQPAKKRRRVIQ